MEIFTHIATKIGELPPFKMENTSFTIACFPEMDHIIMA